MGAQIDVSEPCLYNFFGIISFVMETNLSKKDLAY